MSQSQDNSACFRDEDFLVQEVTASGLPTRATLGEGAPSADEVDICRRWLHDKKRSAYALKSACSYTLKHDVERWAGRYVSNGALIAACVELGVKVKRVGHGVNAYLGLRV